MILRLFRHYLITFNYLHFIHLYDSLSVNTSLDTSPFSPLLFTFFSPHTYIDDLPSLFTFFSPFSFHTYIDDIHHSHTSFELFFIHFHSILFFFTHSFLLYIQPYHTLSHFHWILTTRYSPTFKFLYIFYLLILYLDNFIYITDTFQNNKFFI